MKYFSNLSKYDETGRRLAIFAEVDEEFPGKLHIFILKCSKKDQFTKALAREIFNIYQTKKDIPVIGMDGLEYHPILEVITIDNPATPKKCFLEWCNKTFYSYRKDVVVLPYKPVNITQHSKLLANRLIITKLSKTWVQKVN